MKFGTWYQINCEGPETWADDFAAIRDTGFDFVVLWNVRTPSRGVVDLKPIVEDRKLTMRALDAAGKAGLKASLGVWNPSCMGAIPKPFRVRCSDDGERIEVRRMPTAFGPVSYRIVSRLAAGTVAADVTMPERSAPARCVLRLRTPGRLALRSVTVNGAKHAAFDPAREEIDLTGLSGRLVINADYYECH